MVVVRGQVVTVSYVASVVIPSGADDEAGRADDDGIGFLVLVAIRLLLLAPRLAIVDVDVNVMVDTVLKTEVVDVPPETVVDVTGQVVTVSYVTNVAVPSGVVDEKEAG